MSDAERARAGAPVCLLASEPAAGPTLAEVAARQGRSPLEVLVSLTGRATYEYGDGQATPTMGEPGRGPAGFDTRSS